MNIVDWIYACLIYVWSELDRVALGAGLTAIVVAVLRMRKYGKVLWSEALLCGVFATIAITGASFLITILGIPPDGLLNDIAQGGKHILAGFIGWYGTDRTMSYIENRIGVKHEQEDN